MSHPRFRPTHAAPRCLVRWAAGAGLVVVQVTAQVAAATGPAEATAPAEAGVEQVVVTASRREQRIRSAPASISVIDRAQIDQAAETAVAGMLRRVEGVAVVGGGPDDLDISLRGMPGDYTLLLVDGRRQNTRETMSRGTGGVQPRLLPPLAAIERIEVVRGPMSSLYGSEAMGGVVHIITRRLPPRWRGTASVSALTQQHRELGDARSAEFWLGGPLVQDALGLQLSGRAGARDEDDVFFPRNGNGGASGLRDGALALQLGARLGAGHELRVDLGEEAFSERLTPGLSIDDAPDPDTLRRVRHARRHWGLAHDGHWDWGRSTLALYGETGSQTQWLASGRSAVEPQLHQTTLDARATVPVGEAADVLTVGAQLGRELLDGVAAQDAVPDGLPANPRRLSRQAWALFAEGDMGLGPLTLTAGLRLDHDPRHGAHLSPRLYALYPLNGAWTLRGGVGTGFKSPTLRQGSADYCMTTGGAAGAAPGVLCGNPALQPETAVSAELGLRWDAAGHSASAELFSNRFRNRVTSYDTGRPDPRAPGRHVYVYDNIARVDIDGLALAAEFSLRPGLRLVANTTYTDSRRGASGERAFDGSSLQGRPLDKTPRHMAHLRLSWQARPGLELYGALDHTGRQDWAAFRNGAVGVRTREATTTLDLGGGWTPRRDLTLKLSVLNLTDRRVAVDPRGRYEGLDGNWMVDEGRRLAVSLTAGF